MGSFSIRHWIGVLLVILLLVGSNQIERLFTAARRGAPSRWPMPGAARSFPRMPVLTPVLWLIVAVVALAVLAGVISPR